MNPVERYQPGWTGLGKGIPMDSTARFLLGGALGAAIGYLLSQKNLERAIQSGQLSVPVAAPTGASGTEGRPQAFAPAAAVAPPTVTPQDLAVSAPASAPTREWTIPPAPPADWRPAPETPAVTPLSAAPAAPPPPASVVEAPISEPQLPAEAPESEVIITRDFLEEPIPGSGWRSTAPAAAAETPEHTAPVGASTGWAAEAAVSELPAVEQAVELPVGEQAVDLPVVEEHIADTPSRVDDLKSRIEETRRRIRHELEQPFDNAVATRPPESDWTVSTAAPPLAQGALPAEPVAPAFTPEALAPEAVAVRPVAVEPALVEPIVVEPVGVEPVAMETVAVEAVEVEPVPVETIALEEVVAEPVAVEPVTVEKTAVALVGLEPTAVEPVAAETIAVESSVAEPVAIEPLPLEPVAAEPAAAEPPVAVQPVAVQPVAEPVPVEPVAAEQVIVEADRAETVAESVEVTAETAEDEAEAELGLDQPVDYDSMKDRIETTRSRLKAKAFDAMMTGESALLGRDLGGTDRGLPKVPGVDRDIDQTIETSLREEEE